LLDEYRTSRQLRLDLAVVGETASGGDGQLASATVTT
jgi:hypothetical protein